MSYARDLAHFRRQACTSACMHGSKLPDEVHVLHELIDAPLCLPNTLT